MLTINKSDLQFTKNNTIIDSKNEVFKNTEFYGLDFSIEVTQLSRADSINIMTNSSKIDDGNIKLDAGTMTRDIFVASILSWENITDEDEKEIPCNDFTKAAMWDSKTLIPFTDLLQKAIKDNVNKKEEVAKVVKKKS